MWPARIRQRVFQGDFTQYHVDWDGRRLIVRSAAPEPLAEGDDVFVSAEPAALRAAGGLGPVTRRGPRSSCMVKEASMTGQVLILGGGYAGVYAALGGARARGDAPIDITLVSAEPDLVNRPRLYERDPAPHIRYPLAPMLDRIGVGFRRARVTGIDVEARRVTLAEGAHLAWDRL